MHHDRSPALVLCNSYQENLEDDVGEKPNNENEDARSKRGYKFGDVTRAAVGAFQSKVNSLTGKDTYEFGDLTKFLDAKAKDSAMNLDAAAKSAVMARVTAYTKKSEYRLGDLTKEVFRRFEVGEYKKEDLWLFIRICILIGGSASAGAATALPVKVLLELLEVSMASSVSEDLTSMLTNEINNRMKEFVTGDKNYQFGDMTKNLTKKFLLGDRNSEVDLSQQVIGKVTSKEVVEFSDISKNLILLMAGKKKRTEGETPERESVDSAAKSPSSTQTSDDISPTSIASLDDAALKEFEEWEKKYLEAMNHGKASGNSISEQDYKAWDEKLVQASGESSSRSQGA